MLFLALLCSCGIWHHAAGELPSDLIGNYFSSRNVRSVAILSCASTRKLPLDVEREKTYDITFSYIMRPADVYISNFERRKGGCFEEVVSSWYAGVIFRKIYVI